MPTTTIDHPLIPKGSALSVYARRAKHKVGHYWIIVRVNAPDSSFAYNIGSVFRQNGWRVTYAFTESLERKSFPTRKALIQAMVSGFVGGVK